MRFIDLRSDTVTMPTDEMREAMAKAPVGDSIFRDDPTVNKLEELAAAKVGKEDAIFLQWNFWESISSIYSLPKRARNNYW